MKTPPGWLEWLLETVLKDRFVDESIGDLYEWYEMAASQRRERPWLLFKYLVHTLRPYKLKSIQKLLFLIMDNSLFSNNLKIGMRSLMSHSRFTAINLVGLASAFTAVILIYAYVSFELSYDDFHPKKDQIYRVVYKDLMNGGRGRSTPTPLAPAFLNKLGDMLEFARFGGDLVIAEVDDQRYFEKAFYWGDSSLFDVFELPFLYGNAATALREPNTVVLTEEISEKYFGKDKNPVGQTIPIKVFDSNSDLLLRVDGVMKALPANTDLPFELLGSMVTALELYKQFDKSWGFNWLHTFAYIPQERDLELVETAVEDIIRESLGEDFVPRMGLSFQPLREVHLHSQDVSRSDYGDFNQVLIFMVIGGFLLAIATVNFVNLSASRISKRLKEISIRHVSGASKHQLIQQFTTEFLITTLVSAGIAIIGVLLVWEPFVAFIGKDIPLDILLDWRGALLLACLIFLPGILSALFPSALLARIDPTQLLKGQHRVAGRKTLRLGLVAVQFAITTFLILSTLVIFQQYQRLSEASLGFEQEQLINIKIEDREMQRKIDLLQAEMTRVNGVVGIGASSEALPSDMNNRWRVYWDETSKEEGVAIDIVGVDETYFPTIGTPIIEGINFILPYRSDSARSVILNETAARMMDVNQAGTIINIEGTERRVIGVVSDHHYKSMKSKIEPVAYMVYGPGRRVSPDNLLVRVNVRDLSVTIGELNRVWDEVAPGNFFDFHFVDEAFQNAYEEEAHFSQLFTLFTVLSVIISCIGLLGIVIYLASEKQKEVCIRKVMGSSNWQLTAIVMKELGLMVLVGMALAVPAAVWSLDLWLEQFVFRVPVQWTMVAASILITVALAALAMGRNVLQLIHSNPVRFLRNE